jgi:hypothetical protein
LPLNGLLWKQGRQRTNWKQRYFDVNNLQLTYYQEAEQMRDSLKPESEITAEELASLKNKNLKGTMDLEVGKTEVVVPQKADKFYKTPHAFIVKTEERTLECCCETAQDRRRWVQGLNARVKKDKEIIFKKFLVDAAVKNKKQKMIEKTSEGRRLVADVIHRKGKHRRANRSFTSEFFDQVQVIKE